MKNVRGAKTITLFVCILAVVFLLFFNISKHTPGLVQVNVFNVDPYDAVGSFGIQLALVSALLSLVRILRPYPEGQASLSLGLVLRGDAVALLAILVTLAADAVAMFRYLFRWTATSGGWILAAGLFGLAALALLAAGGVVRLGHSSNLPAGKRVWWRTVALCLAAGIILALYPEAWREKSIPGALLTALTGMVILFVLTAQIARSIFPPVEGSFEDVFEDLGAIYRWAKARAGFAGGLLRRIEAVGSTPWLGRLIAWLNPRRHPYHIPVLVGVGMGLFLVLAEAIAEGAPNGGLILLVIGVFVGIEGAGVLLGYTLFRKYLGIVRDG